MDHQEFRVRLSRRIDGQFYAGRAEGHEMATEAADSIGTPIGGKGSIYPALGNFAAGQTAELHDETGPWQADLGGLKAVVEVPKELLRQLNSSADRVVELRFRGVLTGLNLEEGVLQGSGWVRPTGAIEVGIPGLGLVDRQQFATARAEALKGAEERRATARESLRAMREARVRK